ncbi:MAG TPA: hypothetical protein VHA35_03080 [Dongiaceae bacterium]|nr:hypothetical protein [Dongiaceae bacterium]
MNDGMHPTPPAASPAWLLEPRQVLRAMLDHGLLMFRPYGGTCLLTDEQHRAPPLFVPDIAVDFLLERGWLTLVDDADETGDDLYLLTAEGRRTGAALRAAPR